MLSDTLNGNQIKNSAGTGVTFSRLTVEGRTVEFAQSGETLSQPNRLKISHLESGSGMNLRRRSVVRFDKVSISPVDSKTPVTCSAYCVLDIPQGALNATTEPATVMAYLISFLASLGASTTILYDGTGSGATALLNGSL